MSRRQTTCVNERVAGNRRLSVSGTSPVSHEPYTPGIVDQTTIHDDRDQWSWTPADSYGRVFATSDERDEFLLERGYTRPWFRSPQTRVAHILSQLENRPMVVFSPSLNQMVYPHNLTDREAMEWVARYQRDRAMKSLMRNRGYKRMRDLWIDHPKWGKRFRDREEHEFEMARAKASGYDSV